MNKTGENRLAPESIDVIPLLIIAMPFAEFVHDVVTHRFPSLAGQGAITVIQDPESSYCRFQGLNGTVEVNMFDYQTVAFPEGIQFGVEVIV